MQPSQLTGSENIIQQESPDEIMQAVYDVAEATGLFAVKDNKVRMRPYQYFKLGPGKKDLILRIPLSVRRRWLPLRRLSASRR